MRYANTVQQACLLCMSGDTHAVYTTQRMVIMQIITEYKL